MWKQTIGQEGAAIKQPLHLKAQSVPDKKKQQKKANTQTNDKNLIRLMVFEVGRKKSRPVSCRYGIFTVLNRQAGEQPNRRVALRP